MLIECGQNEGRPRDYFARSTHVQWPTHLTLHGSWCRRLDHARYGLEIFNGQTNAENASVCSCTAVPMPAMRFAPDGYICKRQYGPRARCHSWVQARMPVRMVRRICRTDCYSSLGRTLGAGYWRERRRLEIAASSQFTDLKLLYTTSSTAYGIVFASGLNPSIRCVFVVRYGPRFNSGI